jgi:hypothetical protein
VEKIARARGIQRRRRLSVSGYTEDVLPTDGCEHSCEESAVEAATSSESSWQKIDTRSEGASACRIRVSTCSSTPSAYLVE